MFKQRLDKDLWEMPFNSVFLFYNFELENKYGILWVVPGRIRFPMYGDSGAIISYMSLPFHKVDAK